MSRNRAFLSTMVIAITLFVGSGLALAPGKAEAARACPNIPNTPRMKCVKTRDIKPNAIKENRIRNGAVTNSKIEDGAVSTGKIADEAITTNKIMMNAVTASEISDRAITREKLEPGLLAYWAVIDNQGNLIRHRGAVGSSREAAGTYRVQFSADISQCAYQVSIASPGSQPPTPLNNGLVSVYAPEVDTLEARTYSAQVTPPALQDRPVHFLVNC